MKFNLEHSELNSENPKENETVQIEQRQSGLGTRLLGIS